MEDISKMSCVDCSVGNCNFMDKSFPQFCPTVNTIDEEKRDEIKNVYEEEENRKCMLSAAMVEYEGYGKTTRIEEIMEFARKMGFKKIGIANCLGLIKEAGTLGKILRYNGFDVVGYGCKIGCIPKVEIGIPEECNAVGKNICNPILQAKMLNEAKTELNIVVGLCVGHDSLFYKYSDALVTTAVTKDRVLGHNPVAALYGADFYFKKRMYPPKEDK